MIGLNEAFSTSDGPTKQIRLASVPHIFAAKGYLQSALNLEFRPQQSVMAQATADTFGTDSPLLFEAGTGVGKSLAYLLPGLLHAFDSGRQMVLSTHTIALQEQIEAKDLPICRNLFKSVPSLADVANFKHAILVGRGNYLCTTRLKQAIQGKQELFPTEEMAELQRISDWAESTQTGIYHELSPPPLFNVWEWVNADSPVCNNKNCNHQTCFYRKARQALREANLIIVNHSLLFALLSSGHFPKGDTKGILFPNDFLVLDEAHTVPEIATDFFGISISSKGLRRQLLKLYNPRKKKGRGLLAKYGNPSLMQEVTFLIAEADLFFNHIRSEFLMSGRAMRMQKEEWTANSLDIPLRDLIHSLRQCENKLDEGAGRDELEGLRLSLQSYREGIRDSITLSDPDSVYWIESTGSRDPAVLMRSAPLDIAPHLRERLFNRDTGLLLTSATLAEGPDMTSFVEKIGAESARTKVETSPFDYSMQMQILIASDAPPPDAANARLDIEYLADQIGFACQAIPGGSLVLFTSYRDLNAVEAKLRPVFEKVNRPLLCQGIDGSRGFLTSEMKNLGNAVLFGTDSFWTGIDVPGPALSQVIVTRLPFQNPRDPVTEARSEACRMNGESPFFKLTLPQALVRFRQGIGRLIRNQTDSGILTILDSRILHKPYGSVFLDTLPHTNFICFTSKDKINIFSQLSD